MLDHSDTKDANFRSDSEDDEIVIPFGINAPHKSVSLRFTPDKLAFVRLTALKSAPLKSAPIFNKLYMVVFKTKTDGDTEHLTLSRTVLLNKGMNRLIAEPQSPTLREEQALHPQTFSLGRREPESKSLSLGLPCTQILKRVVKVGLIPLNPPSKGGL